MAGTADLWVILLAVCAYGKIKIPIKYLCLGPYCALLGSSCEPAKPNHVGADIP